MPNSSGKGMGRVWGEVSGSSPNGDKIYLMKKKKKKRCQREWHNLGIWQVCIKHQSKKEVERERIPHTCWKV